VVIGLLAIGQDVSERVKHEKQLLNERTQLIERNKELTSLYSMAKIVGQNKPLAQMLESMPSLFHRRFNTRQSLRPLFAWISIPMVVGIRQ